jgi:hypothetical protein
MSTFKFVVSRWVINTNDDNWKGLRMLEELILEIYWWLYVIRVRLQLNSKKNKRNDIWNFPEGGGD